MLNPTNGSLMLEAPVVAGGVFDADRVRGPW